jgi:hypothetical protein
VPSIDISHTGGCMKKHVVEYTTENPVYNESRGMAKAVAVFVAIILVLAYVF